MPSNLSKLFDKVVNSGKTLECELLPFADNTTSDDESLLVSPKLDDVSLNGFDALNEDIEPNEVLVSEPDNIFAGVLNAASIRENFGNGGDVDVDVDADVDTCSFATYFYHLIIQLCLVTVS